MGVASAPGGMASDPIFQHLAVVVVIVGWIALVGAVLLRLRVRRPGLALATAIAAGATVRLLASIGTSVLPQAPVLRGPDEAVWLGRARDLADAGLYSTAGVESLASELHVWIFAVHLNLLPGVPQHALRVSQIAVATLGVLLLATAVHDLAGRRAGALAAWLLALEPTNIFFASLLHKESLLLFFAGLAALGGAHMWRHGGSAGAPQMLIAGLGAVATRPYAGWFLVGACALIALHATARHLAQSRTSLLVGAAVALAVVASVPTLLQVSSDQNLQAVLQPSQDANASDTRANLSLEPVDFSSRERVVKNLPIRIRDVLLRPYVWQTENLSQQLGAVGGLAALAVFGFLLLQLFRHRGHVLATAGPFVYPSLALLVAFSLSAGNAGTSFRYRTHLIAFALCVIVVLRERQRAPAEAAVRMAEDLPVQEWARRVAATRRDQGLTHPELARRLGVSPWQLNRLQTVPGSLRSLPAGARDKVLVGLAPTESSSEDRIGSELPTVP